MENPIADGLHYCGTSIDLEFFADGRLHRRRYMLVLANDVDYVFYLVCISGYYSGYISGVVENDESIENARAVTLEHLMKQLVRNFGVDVKVLSIRESPDEI